MSDIATARASGELSDGSLAHSSFSPKYHELHPRLGHLVKDSGTSADILSVVTTESDALFFDGAFEVVNETLLPLVDKLEKPGRNLRDEESLALYNRLIKVASNSTLMNLTVPEELGGCGFSLRCAAIVVQALSWGAKSGGLATTLLANDLALTPIVIAGDETQRARFVRDHIRNGGLSAYALTEPSAGSNPAQMTSTLKESGDHYILNGKKAWISNHTLAGQLVVFAKQSELKAESEGAKICCVVVDAKSEGVIIGKPEHKLGQHCSPTGEITFENVVVPKENLIGKPGQGLSIAFRTLRKSRPLTAAIGLGLIGAAREESIKYANVREQGGAKIITHQLIQDHLVAIDALYEEVKLKVLQAVVLEDIAANSASSAFDTRRESSHAKLAVGRAVIDATNRALQVFGGNGYSEEYPIARLLRDGRVIGVYEGTDEIQKIVIARTFTS